MNCPGRNATNPIWKVLASSLGISSWTPLKPQHSNPNSNPLANQLWCIDFLTPPTPLIIPDRHSYGTQKPMLDSCKMVKNSLKHSIRFCGFFPSLKQNFITYRSFKLSSRPDYIFEINQLWQSGFSVVYSNSYYGGSFEPEIINVGQSSHNIYSNNIVNVQESTTFLNSCTKSLETYWLHHVYI